MQTARLYHNPRCSKSRAALELIEARGVEIEVIDYTTWPLSADELRRVIDLLRIRPHALLRKGEPEYASLDLGRDDLEDDAVIGAMCSHPTLIERPIFLYGGRAVIGRPLERVLELLGSNFGEVPVEPSTP